MQLGFVIDHSRCIGCHACTVACKSENDVPVGSFRTWVKYTERGEFPQVKRSFAVLRCNQCSAAPCVEICPVKALEKGANGIVDVDPAACIGCKSCMQACPYDALYINEDSGTAEKCHFCAHRVERGLAPACAVVCPTEAIIPGDFHDPDSRVSRLLASGELRARKVEAGTGPNVFYREVETAGIEPAETSAAGGYLWADRTPSARERTAHVADSTPADQEPTARTTYDVDRKPMWGWRITAYLFTKSLAAGTFLAGAIVLGPAGLVAGDTASLVVLGSCLLFLALTCLLLVTDLKRPERFLYILLRPNWSSWLCKGSVILGAYGAVLAALLAISLYGESELLDLGAVTYVLIFAGVALALLSAVYTAWLFAQAKGRVLWMWTRLADNLAVQAFLAGAGYLLILSVLGLGIDGDVAGKLLLYAVLAHAYLAARRHRGAPPGREAEFARALAVLHGGHYGDRHALACVAVGTVIPTLILLAPGETTEMLAWFAAVAALIGLYVDEDLFVRAGQALPIS